MVAMNALGEQLIQAALLNAGIRLAEIKPGEKVTDRKLYPVISVLRLDSDAEVRENLIICSVVTRKRMYVD